MHFDVHGKIAPRSCPPLEEELEEDELEEDELEEDELDDELLIHL